MKTNLKRRLLSLLLALTFVTSMVVLGSINAVVLADDGDPGTTDPGTTDPGTTDPDTVDDIIVEGTGTINGTVNTSIVAEINLTKETLTVTYKSAEGKDIPIAKGAISINGGEKWRALNKVIDSKALAKLLNKELTLALSTGTIAKKDQDEEKDDTGKITKYPAVKGQPARTGDADLITVTFPTIQKRPKDPKVVVTYAAKTIEPKTKENNGKWAIAARGTADVAVATVKDDENIDRTLIIGDFVQSLRAAESYEEVSVDGFDVPNMKGGKAVTERKFIKIAPLANDNKFYPGSRGRRLSVRSVSKAPVLKLVDVKDGDKKVKGFKVKKGMTLFNVTTDEKVADYTADNLPDGKVIKTNTSNVKTDYVAWTTATAKKPASETSKEISLGTATTAPGTDPGTDPGTGGDDD